MKATSTYHGLALQHSALIKELTERVIQTMAIERLSLLGITTTYSCTESLFSVPPATRSEVTHCYLLAVAHKEEGQCLNNGQDKLESQLTPLVPATVILLSAASFSRWLLEGHPFACNVHGKGYLFCQKEESLLLHPAAVNEEAVQKRSAYLFAQTKIKVRELLAGAELYTIRMQYALAAFLLHQAAEQALRTMLILHTGLHLNTHSLDPLVRCCTLFCYQLPEVFSGVAERERHLFALLQKAYIDARYKEDYRIKREEVTALTEKVKRLQEIFECYGPSAKTN